jgi:hypothetical protein
VEQSVRLCIATWIDADKEGLPAKAALSFQRVFRPVVIKLKHHRFEVSI